ncbi:hypothetical protein GCM10017687_07600 [Streptomyces echinatus]
MTAGCRLRPPAYGGADAAGAPAAGQLPHRDRRRLPVPDEVGQRGSGVALLHQAEKARRVLERPGVRRALGRGTGVVLIGFGVAPAVSSG